MVHIGPTVIMTHVQMIEFIAATGGMNSPSFAWGLALPLAIPLLARDRVWSTAGAGAVTVAGLAAILIADGATLPVTFGWVSLCGASVLIGV